MQKVFPQSFIKKEVIGEVVGFNRLDQSEACEFVSSITGDNSREVVSFGTEAGLFQEVGISTCLLYTSPSPRDRTRSRMPSSA